MSVVGPELPPHLAAKRKRQVEEHDDTPQSTRSSSTSVSSGDGRKQRRVMGPSLPPAALEERPEANPHSEVDSDSDLGPALPPSSSNHDKQSGSQRDQQFIDDTSNAEFTKKPQREEWMLVPPKQDDWSSRVDPTKLRNRKFNTGKGAKAPSGKGAGDNALWTETHEQKRQRLEDEVMGVNKHAQQDQNSKASSRNAAEARETEKRIREYNVRKSSSKLNVSNAYVFSYQEKNRNSSLYSEHKKVTPKEKEDDPSKRAFDKDKDIGLGMKIGHSQKKEMLSRAADFGSRFAGGNYL